MKAINVLCAALTAVLASVAPVALRAQTQNSYVPPGLPARLMIGDSDSVFNGIVTNSLMTNSYVYINFNYTNASGTIKNKTFYDQHPSLNLSLTSYVSFQTYMASNGMNLVAALRADTNYFGSPLHFQGTIRYLLTNYAELTALSFLTDFRSASDVTSNMLYSPPLYDYSVDICLPGLQLVKVDGITVNGYASGYTYCWSNGVETVTGSGPFGFYTTVRQNIVYLGKYYTMYAGINRARITLGANDQVMTYTQYGDPVLHPVLQMSDRTHVQVASARGADTVIEASRDLNSWTPMCTNSWQQSTSLTSSVSIDDRTNSFRFFRAYSY